MVLCVGSFGMAGKKMVICMDFSIMVNDKGL